MINIYETFDTPAEREAYALLESAGIQVEEAFVCYESYEKMEELKMRDAEVRAFSENAGFDTLSEYYAEAADGSEEKKEGLLTRVWEKLLQLITTIKETLFGKKSTGNPNDIVNVPESEVKKHEKLKKFFTDLGSVIKNPLANIGKIAAFIAAVAALIGISFAGYKGIVKMKRKDVEAMHNESNSWFDMAKSGCKNMISGSKQKLLTMKDKDPKNSESSVASRFNEVLNFLKSHSAVISKTVESQAVKADIVDNDGKVIAKGVAKAATA